MQILLFCENASAIITLETERDDGVVVQCRHYPVRGHIVVLEGYPDAVLHHDAEMLLASPLYRELTPEEQDRYYRSQRGQGMIQEGHHA